MIEMARRYSAEDVLEILGGLLGPITGNNPAGWVNLVPERELSLLRDRGTSTRRGQPRKTARRAYIDTSRVKPKRKVSRYQKAFGACLKELKRAHPRTPTTRLMKRAHACARKKKRLGGW